MAFDLKDYVDVAERLREFYEKHPQGRVITTIVEMTEKRVVVKAEAYRESAHAWPSGVGHSQLAIPGATPYTKGAELENAETSAIGRALVAAGLASKRIASADEVAAHRAPEMPPAPEIGHVTPALTGYSDDTKVLDDTDLVMAAKAMGFVEAATLAVDGGTCPRHGKPWKLKEGTSAKTGKEYAFWSCTSKDESAARGWCEQRPSKAWEAAHESRR